MESPTLFKNIELLSLGTGTVGLWLSEIVVFLILLYFVFAVANYPFLYIWSRGYDSRKRLVPIQRFVRFMIVLAAVLTVLEAIARESILFANGLIVVVTIVGVVSQKELIANFIGGIVLTFQQKVQVRRRIQIGTTQGVVESKDLLQVWIKNEKNELISIPNFRFVKEIFSVSDKKLGSIVELKVRHMDLGKRSSRDLRDIVVSCPYRHQNTSIDIVPGDHREVWNIKFYAWSPEAGNHAKQYVMKKLSET
ncbi:MAG: mechanosensitive ion channel [Pseudobacteriovorax sp.]|nr:mechanosensitive ion channel [Pseudobacteriovorax sp.]